MSLSDADLQLIRDEVGDIPDVPTLESYYAELGDTSWIPTALRVLKRRRAQLTGSEVKNVGLPGGLSFGLGSNATSLDKQIDRLEKKLADLDPEDEFEPTGATQSAIVRPRYR